MTTISETLSCLDPAQTDLVRDARFLLADILQQPTTFLLSHSDTELTDEQQQTYHQGLAALQAGKPLAYVLGHQPFWSLDFLVNEHTLIPRPDTEHVVEQVLIAGDQYAQQQSMSTLNVLDLGTGSGVIAICVRHERPAWHVTATDYSADALQVAQQNATLNKADIQFYQGSWYEALSKNESKQTKKYHVIVSNPPYIAPDDAHLADLTHEPITALVADNDGMADIETIVLGATQHLHQSGWLLIEHGYNQGEQVRDCFKAHGFTDIHTVRDYGGNERLTVGQLNGLYLTELTSAG